MPKLLTWLRSKVSTTRVVWCVHCRSKQKVLIRKIIEGQSSKAPYKRLRGQCLSCNKATSTFVT